MSDLDNVTMMGSKHRGAAVASAINPEPQLATESPPLPPIAAERVKGTYPTPMSHNRIARPSKSLDAAENFYVNGLGLEVLFRKNSSQHPEDGGHDLLMVGWKGAAWHLELVQVNDNDNDIQPHPT